MGPPPLGFLRAPPHTSPMSLGGEGGYSPFPGKGQKYLHKEPEISFGASRRYHDEVFHFFRTSFRTGNFFGIVYSVILVCIHLALPPPLKSSAFFLDPKPGPHEKNPWPPVCSPLQKNQPEEGDQSSDLPILLGRNAQFEASSSLPRHGPLVNMEFLGVHSLKASCIEDLGPSRYWHWYHISLYIFLMWFSYFFAQKVVTPRNIR